MEILHANDLDLSNGMDFDLSNTEGLDSSILNAIGANMGKYSGITNESLLNAEGEYSNFRAFGLGKPDSKQIVKWEKTDPKKIADLIAKGVITSIDVDNANAAENYNPNATANTPATVTPNVPPAPSTLPFTDSTSFAAYLSGAKLDNATLKGIVDTFQNIQKGVNNGLSSGDLVISGITFAGKPVNAADATILTAIANDSIATDFLNKLISLTPPVAATNTTATTGGVGGTKSTTSTTTTTPASTAKSSNTGKIIFGVLAIGTVVYLCYHFSNKKSKKIIEIPEIIGLPA